MATKISRARRRGPIGRHQAIGDHRIEDRESAVDIHHLRAGADRRGAGDRAGCDPWQQRAPPVDEGRVLLRDRGQVPGFDRVPVEVRAQILVPGAEDRHGAERGGRQCRPGLRRQRVRGDPRAVVEGREATPPQVVPERPAPGALLLRDGEEHDGPRAVPGSGVRAVAGDRGPALGQVGRGTVGQPVRAGHRYETASGSARRCVSGVAVRGRVLVSAHAPGSPAIRCGATMNLWRSRCFHAGSASRCCPPARR